MDGLLLVAAAWALGATGWRVAGACALAGLARAVGAAAVGVALATLTALVLGVVDAATQVPLVLAALLTWVVARRRSPWRGPHPAGALSTWWRHASRGSRWLAAGSAGAIAGWAAWQMQYPNLGFDGLIYHASIAAVWAQEGTTGSVLDLAYGLPVGNYPLANEAGVAWAMAVADRLSIASLWNPGLWLVLVGSLVVGLRALGVPSWHARAAAAAVATLPIVVDQLRGPYSDLAATAWLAACLALCAVAARRGSVAALGPAVLAGGLAAGAKTTAALIALVGLAWAWRVAGIDAARARRGKVNVGSTDLWVRGTDVHLPGRGVLAAAAGAAVLAGLWPLRNLIEHGAPLWPLATNPGGDPIPAAYAGVDDRFISRAGDLLDQHADAYADVLGGGWLLLAAALTLGLLHRRSRIAALATLAGLALWTVAPYTGIDREDLAAGATRYLLPTLVLAATTVALVGGRIALVLLLTAVFVSVDAIVRTFGGYPETPAVGSIALAAVAGIGVAYLAARFGRARFAPALAVAAGLWIAGTGMGYVSRHQSAIDATRQTPVSVTALIINDPRFREGDQPVGMFPLTLAVLAGDELQHPLSLLPDDAGCAATERPGWVVVRAEPDPVSRRLQACLAPRSPRGQGSGWLLTGP